MKILVLINLFLILLVSCKNSNPTKVEEQENMPPVAFFKVSPETGDLSTIFSFDASESHDAEDPDSLVMVRWDFNGDGLWDTHYQKEKTITHQFSNIGEHVVKLEVKDSNGYLDSSTNKLMVKLSLNLDMVYVQGGQFQMGDQYDIGWQVEKPVHTVSVSDFYLSKYEIS